MKTKRVLLHLTSLLFFGLLTIISLMLLAVHRENKKNGFTRFISKNLLTPARTLNLKKGVYYVAGYTKEHLYLGNELAPDRILCTNYSLSKSQYLKINFFDTTEYLKAVPRITIDSPNVYLIDANTPIILIGKLKSLNVHRLETLTHFAASIPVSPYSYVFKVYDSITKQNILAKCNIDQKYLDKTKKTIEKQNDGIFCLDGMLNYNPKTRHLAYVYYYRNEFIYLDTNLNIIFKGHTIDTTKIAKIKTALVKSTGVLTMETPPLFVNKLSYLSNDWIFINSSLKSDNELRSMFKNNSVIDVYALSNGLYKFSFYIPNIDNGKLKQFYVIDKTLITIYENCIKTFHLNL